MLEKQGRNRSNRSNRSNSTRSSGTGTKGRGKDAASKALVIARIERLPKTTIDSLGGKMAGFR